MKKVLVLMLSVMICMTMLAFTGCSGGSSESEEPAQTETSEETAQEEEPAEEEATEPEASTESSSSSGEIDQTPRERTKEEIEQVVTAIVEKKCKDGVLKDLKVSDSGDDVSVSVVYEGGEGTANLAVSLFGDTIANYTMSLCTNVKTLSYHGEATAISGYENINYAMGDDGKISYSIEKTGDFEDKE